MCRWHKLAAKESATNSVTGWTMRNCIMCEGAKGRKPNTLTAK